MANAQPPNIPGTEVMTDTLDFIKNLWGSMSVPGMNIPGITAPTLSVDELDKKINDLKAVEVWLNLNTSMLRGSIQALEIQRGTIATLKSMGASFAAAVQQPNASEKSLFESVPFASAFFQQPAAATPEKSAPAAVEEPAAPGEAAPNPAAWWNLMQDQFQQAVTNAMTSDPVAGATAMAKEAATKFSDAVNPAPVKAEPVKRAAAKPKTPTAKK